MILTDDAEYPQIYYCQFPRFAERYYAIRNAGAHPVYVSGGFWQRSAHSSEASVQKAYARVTDATIRQQVIAKFAQCPRHLTEPLCY